MTFALSSSSKVTFAGKRYLHMYLSHAFSNEMLPTTLTLTAQAKQFSSFLLVIGRIVSSSEFNAKYAMIDRRWRDAIKRLGDFEYPDSSKRWC
jgi:hypothetical protein